MTVTGVCGGWMGSVKLVPNPGYVTGVPPSARRHAPCEDVSASKAAGAGLWVVRGAC